MSVVGRWMAEIFCAMADSSVGSCIRNTEAEVVALVVGPLVIWVANPIDLTSVVWVNTFSVLWPLVTSHGDPGGPGAGLD